MMQSAVSAPQTQLQLGQRYNPVARAFHWLIVGLLVVQYSTELVLPYVLPKSAEDSLTAWHLSVGPTILLLMVLRLAWRLTHAVPPPPADLSPAVQLLSRTTHWLFYAVLLVLPMQGWVAASAFGSPVYLLGFIRLPALVAENKALAETVGGVHGVVATVLLALIALHVAGALYHRFVKRDEVLQRMLP